MLKSERGSVFTLKNGNVTNRTFGKVTEGRKLSYISYLLQITKIFKRNKFLPSNGQGRIKFTEIYT
jgi:hypothetical protein